MFSDFKLDYRASFALGTDRVSTSYGSQWNNSSVAVAYDNNTDPRFPSFRILDGTNPNDPSIYTLNNIGLGQTYAHDGETAAALDATIPMGSGDRTGEVKVGLSLRQRHRTNEQTSPTFTPNGTIPLTAYTYGPASQIYYDGRYNIGPFISLPSVRNLANGNLGTITDDAEADQSGSTDDKEDVYAAYGQYTAKFRKFVVLAGLRVESTHATYSGYLYNAECDPFNAPLPTTCVPSQPSLSPATQRNSYTDVFPTLQGRFDILDNLIGRLTYSTGIARPGFQQITPGASISVIGASVTVGNPALKPTLGQSFDATLEYYPGDGQIAAAGVFYKQFRDYHCCPN